MADQRANIFAEADMDLTGFKPKTADEPPRPGPEALAGAGQGKFVSRERPKTAEAEKPPQKEKFRYRTGRNQQFNTRASQETIDSFDELAKRLNCPRAEVIERALQALRRELDEQ